MIKLIKIRVVLLLLAIISICVLSTTNDTVSAAKSYEPVKIENIVYCEATNQAYASNEIIVKYRRGYSLQDVEPVRRASLVRSSSVAFGYNLIEIEGDVLEACAELMKSDAVITAEPNYMRRVFREPNDPLWPHQHNLRLSNAIDGWNITTGSTDVTVAVIDTGVDYNHPDLISNLLPGANFRTPGTDYLDDSGHGTGVAGCVAAVGNNEQGIAGAAWNVKILPLRACGGPNLLCSVVHEADAIKEAISQGVDVINLSLGGFEKSSIEEAAINAAWDAGIVIVAAVGNQGLLGKFNDPEKEAFIPYPAGYDKVIGVASVDYPSEGNLKNIKRSEFSNYGDSVSVTAMGSNILTTSPSFIPESPVFGMQKNYGRISGTSFSTPLVSGLAALIKSQFPNLSNYDIRQRIEASAWDIGEPGWDDYFGYGLVNFHAALIGGTHIQNEVLAFGVTTNPIISDDIIVIVKAKVPIIARPVVNYVLMEGTTAVYHGGIPLRQIPGYSNVFTGRLNTKHQGPIRFTVTGSNQDGLLPSLEMEYFKN